MFTRHLSQWEWKHTNPEKSSYSKDTKHCAKGEEVDLRQSFLVPEDIYLDTYLEKF